MKIDSIYKNYHELLDDPSLIFNDFKSSKNYNNILEHVSKQHGIEYNTLIENEFLQKIDSFKDLIDKNDSIGNPNKVNINGFLLSPSNLRYIYHSLLISSKIEKWYDKKDLNIIEIGGGYGGLCFYIKNIIKNININYTIIDLPNANKIQSYYLQKQNINVQLISCFDIDKLKEIKYDLVISNYCLSELGENNKKEYLEKIVRNCEKHFFIWNVLSVEGLDLLSYEIENERPQTNRKILNKFIYSK